MFLPWMLKGTTNITPNLGDVRRCNFDLFVGLVSSYNTAGLLDLKTAYE